MRAMVVMGEMGRSSTISTGTVGPSTNETLREKLRRTFDPFEEQPYHLRSLTPWNGAGDAPTGGFRYALEIDPTFHAWFDLFGNKNGLGGKGE